MSHVTLVAIVVYLSYIQVSEGHETVHTSRIWNRGYEIKGIQVRKVSIEERREQEPGILYFTLPGNIKYIEVVNSNLTVLPPRTFGRDAYWGLYLTNVNIKKIMPGAFKGVTRLEELDLSHNNISQIDYGVFNEFAELMFVNLSHNNIKTISENAFSGTIFLKQLRLQNNKIISLPDHLFNSQKLSLSLVNISFNCLEAIKETFIGLKNLTKLQLSYNNISEISPNSFQGLTSLQYLDMSHNNLYRFRYGLFNSMPYLLYLDFSYNRMSKLPLLYMNLPRLEELHFRNNKIPIDVSRVLYFPALRKVGTDGLNRSCLDLIDIVKPLQNRNIAILGGLNFTEDNIQGIPCYTEENYSRMDNSTNGNFTDVTFHKESFTTDPGEENRIMSIQNDTKYGTDDMVYTEKYSKSNVLEANTSRAGESSVFSSIIIVLLTSITILIAALVYILIKSNGKNKYKLQDTLLTQNSFN